MCDPNHVSSDSDDEVPPGRKFVPFSQCPLACICRTVRYHACSCQETESNHEYDITSVFARSLKNPINYCQTCHTQYLREHSVCGNHSPGKILSIRGTPELKQGEHVMFEKEGDDFVIFFLHYCEECECFDQAHLGFKEEFKTDDHLTEYLTDQTRPHILCEVELDILLSYPPPTPDQG